MSPASSAGRKKGAEAPYSRATPAISSESVETTNSSMYLDASAAAMVYEISGYPAIGYIFFFGMPLEPPRA